MTASSEGPPRPGRLLDCSGVSTGFPGVPEDVQDLLRCAVCRARLLLDNGEFRCADPACELRHPIVDNVPMLINDDASLIANCLGFIGERNEVNAAVDGSYLERQ